MRDRLRRASALGVGADTALSTLMTGLSAGLNYTFRIVVLSALPGKEAAGLYQLVLAYLALVCALADFGLNATMMPRLAYARGPNVPVFRAAFMLRIATIAISWIGLNVYLVVVGEQHLLLYVNVGFIGVFISARLTGLRQTLETLWRIKGRAYVAVAFTVIDSILGLVIVAIVARTGDLTVGTVVLIWTVTSIPGFIMLLVPLIPMLRAADKLRQRIPRRYYKALFYATMPVGLMAVIGQASGHLETFVLKWAGTYADIGGYAVATSPLMGLVFVPVAISVGLSPVVSQVFKGQRADVKMQFIISAGVRIVMLVALAVALTATLFAEEIMSLFPAEYASETYVLRLFSGITALVFLVVAFDQYLLAAGLRQKVLNGALINLTLAIALEIPLVTWYGIRGMLAAKAVALVVTIIYQLNSARRDMRAGALEGLARMVPPVLVGAACIFLTATLPLLMRAPLTLVATAASLVVFGTMRRSELGQLKRIRLS